MVRKKKRYTAEFKEQAVRLAREGDKPAAQVAKELGIPGKTLYAWLQRTKKQEEAGERLTFSEQEELRRLRRENERLKMERDILKKATAFFAKESS